MFILLINSSCRSSVLFDLPDSCVLRKHVGNQRMRSIHLYVLTVLSDDVSEITTVC